MTQLAQRRPTEAPGKVIYTAKTLCPYSKATSGNIDVTYTLV